MRRLLGLIAIIVVALFLYCLYPFYTIYRIDTALKNADELALDALIDWGKVHDSLKKDALNAVALDHLTDRSSSSGSNIESVGSILGMTLGSALVDKMIEAVANGKTVLAAYQNRPNASASDIEWVREVRFLSPTQFHFAVQNPDEKTNALKFVMTLQGIEWRVTRAVLNIGQLANMPDQNAFDTDGDVLSKPARDELKRLIEKPAGR